MTPADLAASPNPLARRYSRFRVAERLLLTGHSHQAWPDVSADGQARAWHDAADLVDDKWAVALEIATAVSSHWSTLLNDTPGRIALGQNTHELVTRLLSALPLGSRPVLVTTDGEFHTIRRQLDRLAEEGLEIVRVAARPVETLAGRLAGHVSDRAAAVLVSSVLYDTAEIVPGLDVVAQACDRHGVTLLVDAYHHVNVVPFDVRSMGLDSAFVTGGGYKYCQLGEGNAFLRVPPGRRLRPVLTGWFAEFSTLAGGRGTSASVAYGDDAARFAGATYDPAAHYRAAAVQAFHREQGLDPSLLREVSRRQVGLLKRLVEALDAPASLLRVAQMPDERRAGFLALRSPTAAELVRELKTRGVRADARGDVLRLGPAPYLSDRQLHEAIEALGEVVDAARPEPRATSVSPASSARRG
ncbi:MAG: kynureninase [Acidimicrobiia bacterium]|nr:kynureninase [Acidimicrobiia bacterium]